ncbi:MAG: hypothetical protein ABWX82_01745 [Leifsonia sp.]
MSDPTNADQPDVLEEPDATVPEEADRRQTEPDDTLGLSARDGDPMDETTPVDNLE